MKPYPTWPMVVWYTVLSVESTLHILYHSSESGILDQPVTKLFSLRSTQITSCTLKLLAIGRKSFVIWIKMYNTEPNVATDVFHTIHFKTNPCQSWCWYDGKSSMHYPFSISQGWNLWSMSSPNEVSISESVMVLLSSWHFFPFLVERDFFALPSKGTHCEL